MANTYNIKVTGTLDTSKIQEALKGVEQKYGNVKIGTGAASGIKSIGTAAKESKGMLGEFTSQLTNLSSTIPKVAAFGVATMAVNAFRDAIADGVQAVFDMDAALTEFRKVSDISGEELDKYVDKATTLGTTVARTGREMVDAATTFKKSGYTEDEALQLAKIASMYQNIADTEVSSAEAASFVISQMKAFNITAENSIDIIDKTNAVANNLAVGTNDLSKAMEIAGAGLSTYGNDINDMISLVTAGTEIMVGRSSQVARGLNTIASRIVKNEDALKKYNISIYDTNGSLRSTYDILADLAPKWKTMGDAERVALGDTLAGTNQYKVLASVMQNFDSALKAHEIALDASGSAMTENARAIDSLQGHLNQLKAQFEALANNAISSNFIKSLLDAGADILKFANSDVGQAVIKMAAFTLGFKALSGIGGKFVSSVIPKLISGFDAILTSLINVSTGVSVFSGALDGIAASIAAINPATIIVLGVALAEIIGNATSAEAQFDRLNSKFDESKTQLETISAEYDTLKSKSDLTQAEEARLKVLESQLATLKEQTAEYAKQAADAYAKTSTTVTGGGEGIGGGLGVGAVQTTNAAEKATNAVKDWTNATDEAKQAADEYAQILYTTKEALDGVGEKLTDEQNAYLDLYEAVNNNILATQDAQLAEDSLSTSIFNSIDALNSKISALKEQDDAIITNWNSMQDLVAAEEQLRNGQALEESQILSLIAKYPVLANNIDAMRNGELSAAEAIHQVGVQSVGASKTVIANSKAEADAIVANAQAEIKAIIAVLTALEQKKLASGDERRVIEQGAEYQRILRGLGQAQQALREASALSTMYASVSNYTTDVITGSTGATKANTSATKSNTSATKANTDAQEKAKKAHDELVNSLKDVADAYKTAAKYMASQIEIEINSLEKRKDAIEESYDAQIKAIQDANDAIEEQMELEKAQQALAEAKKKRQLVFTGGQFQYVEDAKAIAEAQENLNEVIRKQELEKQVESLENARDAELRAIDDQIAGWEKYKEQWESLANSYEEQQDKLIAQQILGIKLEGDNWQKRLTNAQAFVDQYKKIMAQLDVLEGSDTSTPQSAKNVLNQAKTLGTKGFANGTTSTPAGIYKVGEAGSELMVGRGNGVIPHNLTENLMKLGQFSPSEWVNSIKGTFADRNQTVVQQFGDISLPNVSNASQFVEQLKQFKNYAVQATSRR